jgi:hypothetical protein
VGESQAVERDLKGEQEHQRQVLRMGVPIGYLMYVVVVQTVGVLVVMKTTALMKSEA